MIDEAERFNAEAIRLTEEDLIRVGLGHVQLIDAERMYLLARVKEMEGIALERTGETDKAEEEYLSALRIFDDEGLLGECLRVSQRLGNEAMKLKYESAFREHLKQKSFSKKPCGIVEMFYMEVTA